MSQIIEPDHNSLNPAEASSPECSSIAQSISISSRNDTGTSITSVSESIPDKTSYDAVSIREKVVNPRYIALGTIKLAGDAESGWDMCGILEDEEYPHPLLGLAQVRRWIIIDDLSVCQDHPRLHIYVLPEDVDRVGRGSVKEFRKVIQLLLTITDRSVAAWRGEYENLNISESFEISRPEHEESLFYIFNTLRSPSPNLSNVQNSNDGYQAVRDVLKDDIVGLKTPLYSYQRRSVATMVQRENEPANLIDPRKTLFNDVYGRPYYLDVQDGALVKTPPLYPEPRGGILAETMGYGKTLICLTLILATRGHYPRLPEDHVDNLPVEKYSKVGSLLSMAARKTKHAGVSWKGEFYRLSKMGLHYENCIGEVEKYDRAYEEPLFNPTTPGRRCKSEFSNLIRLSSATLVVVPPNLLLQWQQEISKHVEIDALNVLVIDSLTKEFPTWQTLIKYDMVLITKLKFEQEYQDDDLHQGKRKMGSAKYRSPLTQVRWLRVICDEGHGFAGSSAHTRAMAMLNNMYCERRWVVSGTPSSTLHGVEVGLSTTSPLSPDITSDSMALSPAPPGRRESISTTLNRRKSPTSHDQEAKDLERLRIMVVKFLHLQPWANQRGKDDANWKKYLLPKSDVFGRRTSSSSTLREVLQTLIIRHRIEDIDTDLVLPPLHNKIVYLKPSYHDKLSLNMFSLVLTSNYVTSEREDEDYMFHPKNRKKFDLLVNNLQHATFHWVGFSQHDIEETLRVSKEYLEKNRDKIRKEDVLLLIDAIEAAQRALADPSWVSFSKLHEIGCYVKLFPEIAREAWALDSRAHDPLLLGTVQAREAQKFYQKQIMDGVEDTVSTMVGKGLKVMSAARAEADGKNVDSNNETSGHKRPQIGTAEEPRLKVTLSPTASSKTTIHPEKPLRSRKRPRTVPRIHPDLTLQRDQTHPSAEPRSVIDAPPTSIVGFTSAKLAYLMDQLLLHSETSKCIVFYSSNNTAFWTAEALELLHIPFLIYANTLSVAQRNKYLSMFNTDDKIRVLLMDLKQASHGLHIASANRVYIITPIWNKSVESQAIKRAHRIGQTRPVFVETLVLEGTFEDEMVKRRQFIDNNEGKQVAVENENSDPLTPMRSASTRKQKEQSLLDDQHMVQVLKDVKFLPFSKDEDEHVGARVAVLNTPSKSRMLFSTPSRDGVSIDVHDKPESDLAGEASGLVKEKDDLTEGGPKKKIRTVKFADD